MSLLACVDYAAPATLLHPLRLRDGGTAEVKVIPLGDRVFRLEPYPLREERITIDFPARHVASKSFTSSEHLRQAFQNAPVETLTLALSD